MSKDGKNKLFNVNGIQTKINQYFEWLYKTSNEQIAILDKNSKFLFLNDAYSKLIGYPENQKALGLSYDAFQSKASESANLFASQDQMVLKSQKPIEFLSYHQYTNNQWHLLYGEKNCLLDENNQAMGVFSKAKDVSSHGLIDISRFLIHDNLYYFGQLKKESFTYYIHRQNDEFHKLTRCEKECLFYFIRGKTSQDIANILHRSKRTIDMHLESIKNKLQVNTKPLLIEKVIQEGFMSILPESLFSKLKY